MHSLCSSSPPKLRSALEVVEEEELKAQLELEPLGAVRIADVVRWPVAVSTALRSAICETRPRSSPTSS